jgi:holin-like protein
MAKGGRWLVGWGVILLCYYGGIVISTSFNLPVPGTLVGLCLLLIMLFLFSGLDTLIALAAAPLLTHMSLLFVPAVLGIGIYWQDIWQNGLAIGVAIVVSTAISLGLTGKVTELVFGNRGKVTGNRRL